MALNAMNLLIALVSSANAGCFFSKFLNNNGATLPEGHPAVHRTLAAKDKKRHSPYATPFMPPALFDVQQTSVAIAQVSYCCGS